MDDFLTKLEREVAPGRKPSVKKLTAFKESNIDSGGILIKAPIAHGNQVNLDDLDKEFAKA